MKLEAKQRLIATEEYNDADIIEYAKQAGLEKSIVMHGNELGNKDELMKLLEKAGWLGN